MNGVISLQIWQLAAAYIFIFILLFIVRKRGIPREKEILISSLRMTIQLVLTGYVLIYIFDNASPIFTILVICIMETFAIYNIFNRTKINLSKDLKKTISISMIFGTLTSLFYFLFIVIGISPWYDPRYFIPIAGMLIGNSMVGMGIVFLPGMMTGQILSGTSPVTAIGYQIAIMLGVLGSVSLSVILFVNLGYKTFFNEESQLIISE